MRAVSGPGRTGLSPLWCLLPRLASSGSQLEFALTMFCRPLGDRAVVAEQVSDGRGSLCECEAFLWGREQNRDETYRGNAAGEVRGTPAGGADFDAEGQYHGSPCGHANTLKTCRATSCGSRMSSQGLLHGTDPQVFDRSALGSRGNRLTGVKGSPMRDKVVNQ